MIALLLGACSGESPTLTGPQGGDEVTSYQVLTSSEPAELVAGQQVEFYVSIVDQLGRPIPDLQQSHERMVHNVFISEDLEDFQHIHHEDFYEITADDLRNSTFHFPLTLPTQGRFRAIFDYAHHNFFQQSVAWLEVSGAPGQLQAPIPDMASEREVDGLEVTLAWEAPPVVGETAAWTIHITDAGEDVTDIVQWLGADGHVVIVSEDLAFTSHTHAWIEGMDNMAPGMTMPHLYSGPDLTFKYTFTEPGLYKMWMQFARAGAPDAPFTAPFWFEVAP